MKPSDHLATALNRLSDAAVALSAAGCSPQSRDEDVILKAINHINGLYIGALTAEKPFAIGNPETDTVTQRSYNRRGAESHRVVKVGPKLITLRNPHGRETTHRRDSGDANDGYGHEWIDTYDLIRINRDSPVKQRMDP